MDPNQIIPTRATTLEYLAKCLDLFQPGNAQFYFCWNGDKTCRSIMDPVPGTPAQLPQGFPELWKFAMEVHRFSISLNFLNGIHLFQAAEEAETLTFQECNRYLIYYTRLLDKNGYEAFLTLWENGGTIRVLRRMLATLNTHDFSEAELMARNPQAELAQELSRLASAVDALKLEIGDLTRIYCDAIVCPDDERLSGSGGVSAAVRKAAGPTLEEQVERYRELAAKDERFRLRPGNVKEFFDHHLPAKNVIFTVGPRWQGGSHEEEAQLASCYCSAMDSVFSRSYESVAFPTISTGTYGFPPDRAAEIAVRTILHKLSEPRARKPMKRVYLVCHSEKQAIHYRAAMRKVILELFLQYYSPEFMVCRGLGAFDTNLYFQCMTALMHLEGPGYNYQDHLNGVMPQLIAKKPEYFVTAQDCAGWSYLTCLSYIIYLQRNDYWSGGLSNTHFTMCRLGSVRTVLLRMQQLL